MNILYFVFGVLIWVVITAGASAYVAVNHPRWDKFTEFFSFGIFMIGMLFLFIWVSAGE